MRSTLLVLLLALPAFAFADGPSDSKGVLVLQYNGKTCGPVADLSVIFRMGSFPFSKVTSRVESVSDVSESENQIRLRLYGWVKEMTDFKKADLLIKASSDVLNKFRSDPNIKNRFIAVTTDARCASAAALVEVAEYIYDWK